MLEIFICEDDQRQRNQLEKEIEKFIFMEDIEAKLSVVTQNPQDILTYLQKAPKTSGLYFLDIDLGCKETGIDLAVEIKKIDIFAKFVFITTHGEMMHLTFFHHLEAMDYINKGPIFDDVIRRAIFCVKEAYNRYLKEQAPDNHDKIFKIKRGSNIKVFQMEDILYFTSNGPRMMELVTKNGVYHFSGAMKDIEKESKRFVRIHNSYLVNANNIKQIDKKNKEIEMMNGITCYASVRGLKKLEHEMKALK